MPTWPSTHVSKTHLSIASNPADTFSDLEAYADAINAIMDLRGEALGIASLDTDGYLPEYQLNPNALLNVLRDVDGVDSELDADLLDGLEGAVYALTNGTRAFTVTTPDIFTVGAVTPATNAVHTGFTLRADPASSRGTNYGIAMKYQLRNAGNNVIDAARVGAKWTTATAASEAALLEIDVAVAGSLTTAMRIRKGTIEVPELTGVTGQPPSGWHWIYVTSGGLAVRDDMGAETLLTSAANTDHGALSGLNDPTDHPWALDVNGTNAMAAQLDVAGNWVQFTNRSVPATPVSNKVRLYAASNELRYVKSDGSVVALIGSAGVTDHGALTGLDDPADHPWALSAEPAGNTDINVAFNDRDWTWFGVGGTPILALDAAEEAIGIGRNAPDGTARVMIECTGGMAGLDVLTVSGIGAYIHTSAAMAVQAITSGTTTLAEFTRTGASSLPGVHISDSNAASTGNAFQVSSGATAGGIALFEGPGGAPYLSLVPGIIEINSGLNAIDLVMGGTTEPNLFKVSATDELVSINGDYTTGRLNVDGDGLDAVYGRSANVSGKYGVYGDGSGSSGGVRASASAGTALFASASSGISGYFVRNAPAGVNPILKVEAQASGDGGDGVQIAYAGTGHILNVVEDGTRTFTIASTAGAPTRAGVAEWREFDQVDTVPTPETFFWRVYFKPDGMYHLDDAGNEVGPLGEGGGNVISDANATRTPGFVEQYVATVTGQAYVDTTVSAPAGSYIERVLVRTGVAVPGGYHVGVAGADKRFGENVGGNVGDTNLAFSKTPSPVACGDTAMTVKITSAAGGGTFADSLGRIRVTIFFVRFTAATS